MSPFGWQKSSFSSGGEGNCIELAAATPHRIHLRESDRPTRPPRPPPAPWRTSCTRSRAAASVAEAQVGEDHVPYSVDGVGVDGGEDREGVVPAGGGEGFP